MTKRQQPPVERRCKAQTKRGDPCRATVVGADGYCSAHSGRQDMRELGRKGGRGRSRPNAARVHESLRTYLKREVPPERIWQALEAAMLGNNDSARVSASRVLMDALHEPEYDKDEHQRERAGAEARERLAQLLETRAGASERAMRSELLTIAEEMRTAAVAMHPDLIVGDVSPEAAEKIFQDLEAMGMIAGRERIEQRAEERAQERVAALRAEFGIPHP
jgi:signal recognition particle GTPase